MKPIQFPKFAARTVWCSILLGSLILLFSCEIDEEKNLLFNLKDALKASGTWQAATGLDKFDFEVDGDFSVRIGSSSGNGTYRYYETTSESIFSSGKQVAKFRLIWKHGPTALTGTTTLKVLKKANGDLYFDYNGSQFTQTK